MSEITRETSVAEVVRQCPEARRIFDEHGLRGCGGVHGPAESLQFFASVHQVDVDQLVRELNDEMRKPHKPYVYQESLPDFIYRRFFKAGIAIVLSVGGLWGAVNLAQIALGRNFLQLRLLPAIHAHAHAMIFGWVGLFVMGFAYQSFPRFKNTTLWRPDLANASFYLMLAGIVARMSAELLQPRPVALALGGFAAVAEMAAISLFLLIIYRTARQSVEPHNPYEKFLLASFAWFFLQAIVSDVFFFAKATAATQSELIRRIALIDGPLRDIQVLGFAALVIAGVSQRFVPRVYALAPPKRDRLNLIFALMNLSLVLDIVSYVAVVSKHNWYYAIGLELGYLMMPLWAVLLARQLGVFGRPGNTDRSFKFIRAAYVWLIIATAMMPLFPLYGALTHQVFAHSYIGAQRHAITVGFISLMILGVSARVVPILAGVDSRKLDSLWAPFLLINLGCAGRVGLQILTDFSPTVTYPLIGLTGFIEVVALAWWGIGLWRVMNLARTHRPQVLTAPLVMPMAR
ncbi:MAG TPA: NnrS family protein [Terriglobales bacterium]|nr:NnrS family protein [Terriglobales bacterium]